MGVLMYDAESVLKKGAKGYYKSKSRGPPKVRIFAVKCFRPGISFNRIMAEKPRCLILASGTLSPMDILEEELGVPFPLKFCS